MGGNRRGIVASADWFLITASPYYRQPVFPYDKSRIWLMSKVTRSPSETEANWKTEEDDMTEGDLGYGLGGRPGGIYEVSCSSPSKKRSDGRNLSPPPFPRKGAERSETIFQYSGTEGLWDTCPHGCRATGYGRQSSAGENSSAACSPSSPGGDRLSVLSLSWHAKISNPRRFSSLSL